jgi:hypothetical protein
VLPLAPEEQVQVWRLALAHLERQEQEQVLALLLAHTHQ